MRHFCGTLYRILSKIKLLLFCPLSDYLNSPLEHLASSCLKAQKQGKEIEYICLDLIWYIIFLNWQVSWSIICNNLTEKKKNGCGKWWKKRPKRARNAFYSRNFFIPELKLIRIDQPINQNRDDKCEYKNSAEGKLS